MARRQVSQVDADMGLATDESPVRWLFAFGAGFLSLIALVLLLIGRSAMETTPPPPALPMQYAYLLDAGVPRRSEGEGRSGHLFDCVILAKVGYGKRSDRSGQFAVAFYVDGEVEMDCSLTNGLDGRYRGRIGPEMLAGLDGAIAASKLGDSSARIESVNGCGDVCCIAIKNGELVKVFDGNSPPRHQGMSQLATYLDGLKGKVTWSKE